MKTEYIDWLEFVDYWMDHCSTNGLSVVALDKENSRVAGVFIVRDLLMVPPGFDDEYKSDLLRILVGEMPSTSDSFLTSWQNWTLIRVGIVIVGAMTSVVF